MEQEHGSQRRSGIFSVYALEDSTTVDPSLFPNRTAAVDKRDPPSLLVWAYIPLRILSAVALCLRRRQPLSCPLPLFVALQPVVFSSLCSSRTDSSTRPTICTLRSGIAQLQLYSFHTIIYFRLDVGCCLVGVLAKAVLDRRLPSSSSVRLLKTSLKPTSTD